MGGFNAYREATVGPEISWPFMVSDRIIEKGPTVFRS